MFCASFGVVVYNLDRNYFIIVSFCIWHRLMNKWCSVITQPGKNATRGKNTRKGNKRSKVPTYRFGRVDEVKYLDYANGGQTLTDSGTANLMNACIQGLDSIGQRIGREIIMKKIIVRLTAGVQAADLVAGTGYINDSDTIRCVIVFDKQTNGAAASWSSLMNTSGNAGAPFGNRNVSTLDRYQVLADKTFQVCSAGPNSIDHTFTIPCNLETRFTSTNNGDVTDIISGSLYVITVDGNSTANLPGQFSTYTRVEFIDP